jgi:hypothetical protein
MDLLELLAEKDDPGVKPVKVSLAQLRKLMAAGSGGASLRFTSEGTVRERARSARPDKSTAAAGAEADAQAGSPLGEGNSWEEAFTRAKKRRRDR